MTRALRATTIAALALLAASCVRLGHIQQTEPIRTLQFTGDHKAVAQCVQQRLGGKVQEESLAERYVIYDSAKTHETEGLTHYAVTVGKSGPDKGFAEWRIMRPARQAGPGAPGRPLSRAMIEQYWGPVQQCAKQAKPSQPLG
jgi:hypothetical protein